MLRYVGERVRWNGAQVGLGSVFVCLVNDVPVLALPWPRSVRVTRRCLSEAVIVVTVRMVACEGAE